MLTKEEKLTFVFCSQKVTQSLVSARKSKLKLTRYKIRVQAWCWFMLKKIWSLILFYAHKTPRPSVVCAQENVGTVAGAPVLACMYVCVCVCVCGGHS